MYEESGEGGDDVFWVSIRRTEMLQEGVVLNRQSTYAYFDHGNERRTNVQLELISTISHVLPALTCRSLSNIFQRSIS